MNGQSLTQLIPIRPPPFLLLTETTNKLLQLCLHANDIEVQETGNKQTVDGHSSYEDSEGDVKTPGDSSDDDFLGKKYSPSVPVVTDHTDWTKCTWVVGTRFPSRDAFKQVVKKYVVANGKNVVVSVSNKNRGGRIGITCVKDCPFNIYCSFHEEKNCYMVKKAINKHNCQRNMKKNRQLSYIFIANDFLLVFKRKPHWSAKDIQLAVKEKYKF